MEGKGQIIIVPMWITVFGANINYNHWYINNYILERQNYTY